MAGKKILYALSLILALGMWSCSDDDPSEEEVWESRNTEYFAKVYNTAKTQQGNGSQWMIIKSVQRNGKTEAIDDNIVVQILDSVPGNYVKGSPYQNDSVRVHYKGTNIDDKVFDRSWTGDYDISKMKPASFTVNGVIEGFSTALQYMHIGDHWKVYIPQKLGYGKAKTSELIPPYSTLIFELTLDSYSRPGQPMPVYK